MVSQFARKNILVTGGTGFVGAHLVERLLNEGAHVFTTHLQTHPRSYFCLMRLDTKVVDMQLDICDFDLLHGFIVKNRIEYIFHLAAQAFVDVAYLQPKETLRTNIMGTVHILESARHNPRIKAVVIASSDKAYGEMTQRKYVETDPLQGRGIYEVSKSCADLTAHAYAHTYDLPVTVARFGNIYGEGDCDTTRLVPGLLDALVRKHTFFIRSDGTPTRDYLYVKDVVDGYLLLASRIKKSQGNAYNFGSPDSYSVLGLIQEAETILKKKIPYHINNTVTHEIIHQHLDYSKVTTQLGWKPVTRFNSIFPQLYEWHQKHS